DAYSDGPSSPFGAGSAGTGTISAVAMFSPAEVASIKFGRTTVATKPSKGLTANYLRGSRHFSFYYINGGTPTAFWAYLDGLGGATGTQTLRIALYGEPMVLQPNFKVFESDVVTIAAGTPP